MIALARIADRGPLNAAALAAFLLLGALWVPVLMIASSGSPFIVILVSSLSMLCLVASAAVVAFVALRHGELSALKVAGGCLFLLVAVSLVLYGSAAHIPLIAIIYWLPAIVAAFVLARTVKLELSVLAIVFCGLVAVIAFVLLVGDTEDFLKSQFAGVAAPSENAPSGGDATPGSPILSAEQQEILVQKIAWTIPGAFGVSVMSVALGALFLARSWQAGLFNPGGFQKEFHALKLGRSTSFVGGAIVLVALLQGGQLLGAVAMVVIFCFFLQGLAVMHALVKQRSMHPYWLHGLYILVLILPHTFVLVAALGLADNLYALRRPSEQ